MKFDLFNAMAILKRELSDTAELCISNIDIEINVKLTVFHRQQFHHRQFIVMSHQLWAASSTGMFNRLFMSNMEELKEYLTDQKK